MRTLIRRKRDEFVKPYANDVISATGLLPLQERRIQYRVFSGMALMFETEIHKAHRLFQKAAKHMDIFELPTVFSVSAPSRYLDMPVLSMVTPSPSTFGVMRFLAHPLAHEIPAAIPWLYQDTQKAFLQFMQQDFSTVTRASLLRQIENFKIFNSRLVRSNVKEVLSKRFKKIKIGEWFESPRVIWPSLFPLPENPEYLASSVFFWMQLLGVTRSNWQILWHGKTNTHGPKMIFSKTAEYSALLAALWAMPEIPSKNTSILPFQLHWSLGKCLRNGREFFDF